MEIMRFQQSQAIKLCVEDFLSAQLSLQMTSDTCQRRGEKVGLSLCLFSLCGTLEIVCSQLHASASLHYTARTCSNLFLVINMMIVLEIIQFSSHSKIPYIRGCRRKWYIEIGGW